MIQIAVIGNARGLAADLAASGIEALVRPLDEAEATSVEAAGLRAVASQRDFLELLEPERVFLLDLPMGARVDEVIDEAYLAMEPGDIVIDPTGSYWGDTLRRYRRMRHRSLFYLDIARIRRGGEEALLVAGDEPGVRLARPALEAMAAPGRLCHVGSSGLAHFAAMVEEAAAGVLHQLRSETSMLMEAWPGTVDDEAIKDLWPLPDEPLTGRSSWLLDDALRLEAAVPLMAQATMLNLAELLDAHSSAPPAERGPFVHPDDLP